jgi:uncharacterized RDD family membrane protein YckC
MFLNPLLQDYRDDVKENTGRRGLALLIDLGILGVAMFFLNAIMVFAVFQANPFSLIIGLLGPVIYEYEVFGVESASIFLAMIPFSVVHLAITIPFFTVLESNGRRTLGKRWMHLDILRRDGKFPIPSQAFQRNLLKFTAGALGAYIGGILGWGLFIGLACYIDLKIYPSKKRDIRQRFTEARLGTMVFLEDDEIPMGGISLPGEKIQEKKKEKIGSKLGDLKPRKMRPSPTLGLKKEEPLLGKKERPLLGAPVDDEEEEEEIEEEKEAPVGKKLFQPVAEEGPEEEIEEKETKKEKVSFLKKLFGGGGEKKAEEKEEEKPPEEKKKEPVPLPPRKEIAREEIVLQFMFDFDIDERRAQGLYDMGYRNKAEFKDAIPQDLMMIEGINPTIAKRIIRSAEA